MICTRISTMFEIDYPIILGHLYWLGQGELAASVSEAGGLGVITAGWFKNKGELAAELANVRTLTRRPIGLAVTVDSDPVWKGFIEAAVDTRVSAVFTSGMTLPEIPLALRPAGIKWVPAARTIEEGLECERLGADAVTLEGSPILLSRAAASLGIPVICSGQVCDGRTFLSTLTLGVEGASITTRFIATRESLAHRSIKTAILESIDNNSLGVFPPHLEKVLTALQNWRPQTRNDEGLDEFDRLLARAGEAAYLSLAKEEAEKGLLTRMPGLDAVAVIPSVQEVVDSLVKEAQEARSRVSDFLSPVKANQGSPATVQLQTIPYPF